MKKLGIIFCIAFIMTCFTSCGADSYKEEYSTQGGISTSAADNLIYDYNELPEDFYQEIAEAGSLEIVDYTVMGKAGDQIKKQAKVYLPYGYYQEDNQDMQYNILYLMHGTEGSIDSWFGPEDQPTLFKNVIDNMIEAGAIEPLIIVTPTYYTNTSSGYFDDDEEAKLFQKEFVENLIPAVEDKYRTYAKSTDKKGIKESREHRSYGGYSMGGVTSWYTFSRNLEAVKYFLPMSGDCWELGIMGGKSQPKETAKYLADVVQASEYSAKDYFIYAAAGDSGEAYESMVAMMDGLKSQPDYFIFPEENNLEENNLEESNLDVSNSDLVDFSNVRFDLVHGYEHDYIYGWQYIYNALPYFFLED